MSLPTHPAQPSPARRSVAASALLNLIGLLAPAATAILAIPAVYARLGTERLAVLSLAWISVGAFTLLDFGLGRALTHEVATRLSTGAGGIRTVVTASLAVLAAIGVVLGAAIAAAAPWIAEWFDVPGPLLGEFVAAIRWVGVAVPFLTVASGARGVLEAFGRFDLANFVRVPLGVFTYVAPWLASLLTPSVAVATAALVAVRAVAGVAWTALCLPLLGRAPTGLRWADAARVATSGGWMTLANLAGAVLAYVDRLIVGAQVPISALAFYNTPQEIVGRLTVMPVALNGALFPALSAAGARGSTDLSRLFAAGLGYTFALVFPLALVLAAAAPEWLALWLGADFAARATLVSIWLCAAVLLQCLGITAINLLQATGHSALTANLQVLQVPIFIAALWWATARWGIDGAAAVWAGRMLLDLVMLLIAIARRVPGAAETVRRFWVTLAWALTALLLLVPSTGPRWRFGVAVGGLALLGWQLPRLVGTGHDAPWRRLTAAATGQRRGE